MLASSVSAAWAGDECASAHDLVALQVAAVQQELVVAGLACGQSGLYNTFVVTYRNELRNSDDALKSFFARVRPDRGTSEYDAYKTRVANLYSIRNARDKRGFCTASLAAFRAALNEGKKTLAQFALAQPVLFTRNYDSCGETVQGMAVAAAEPRPAPAYQAPVDSNYGSDPRGHAREPAFENAGPSYAPPSRRASRVMRLRRHEARERYRAPYDDDWYGPAPGYYLRRW
jgi:hypothetical protein